MDPRPDCAITTMYHAVKIIARVPRIQFISPLLIVGSGRHFPSSAEGDKRVLGREAMGAGR